MAPCPTCHWRRQRERAVSLTGYPTCGRCYFARKRRRPLAMTVLVGATGPTRTGAGALARDSREQPREVA